MSEISEQAVHGPRLALEPFDQGALAFPDILSKVSSPVVWLLDLLECLVKLRGNRTAMQGK